jgi:ethylmalonyl-CoA/methylmalonyl-CoA decarboxylase
MILQLADALDELFVNDQNKCSKELPLCLILRGEGKYFCSGLDFSLAQSTVNTSQRGGLMLDFMTDALNRIRQSGLVSLCLINGPALGGGSELITCCDYRLIASDSFIQYVHAKLGAAPGWGGAHRLYNIVGRRHALRLLGTSNRVSPAEALSLGLCDGIVETGNITGASGENIDNRERVMTDSAMKFLAPFIDQPYPASVRAIKEVIASGESVEGSTLPSFKTNDDILLLKESTSVMQKRERDAFVGRWFGPDNLEAISKAVGGTSKNKEK